MVRRTAALIALFVMTASLGATTPALGAAVLDGIYARVSTAEGMAAVLVVDHGHIDRTARLRAGLVGFPRDADVHVAGRSISCAGAPRRANLELSMTVRTSGQGAVFATRRVPTTGYGDIETVWMKAPTGHLLACVRVAAYGDPIPADASAGPRIPPPPMRPGAISAGTFGSGHAVILVETLPGGSARVTALVSGLEREHGYTLRGATVPCGRRPAATPVFTLRLPSPGVDRAAVAEVSISRQGIRALHSMRIVDADQHTAWGCGAAELIGILPY